MTQWIASADTSGRGRNTFSRPIRSGARSSSRGPSRGRGAAPREWPSPACARRNRCWTSIGRTSAPTISAYSPSEYLAKIRIQLPSDQSSARNLTERLLARTSFFSLCLRRHVSLAPNLHKVLSGQQRYTNVGTSQWERPSRILSFDPLPPHCQTTLTFREIWWRSPVGASTSSSTLRATWRLRRGARRPELWAAGCGATRALARIRRAHRPLDQHHVRLSRACAVDTDGAP